MPKACLRYGGWVEQESPQQARCLNCGWVLFSHPSDDTPWVEEAPLEEASEQPEQYPWLGRREGRR